MKQYTVQKAGETANWESIPELTIAHPYYNTPDYIKAFAQIAYNDEALLVHMRLEAPEIRNVEEGPLGRPCVDSCLEFFFSPMEGDIRYFNIEFNLGGCLCFCMGDGKGLTRFTIAKPEEAMSFRSVRTEKGFEIEYQVPYGIIRRFFPEFTPYSGKKMRANCYSCAELTQQKHFLSWNLIDDTRFSFHRPECFGTMIFE